MSLTADELALFGPAPVVSPTEDKPKISLPMDTAHAAVLPPDAPKNDASLPPPVKAKRSKAPVIMPPCSACGVDLNPENSSRLRDGTFKHIGCAAMTRADVVEMPEEDIKKKVSEMIAEVSQPRSTSTPVCHEQPPFKPLPDYLPHNQRITIELGPETLAILRALIK